MISVAKLSVISFTSTFLVSCIGLLVLPRLGYDLNLYEHLWFIPSYYLFINAFLFVILSGFSYQVAVRAAFLGVTLAIGIIISVLAPSSWVPSGWYICIMSIFHYSEFLMIATTNPRTLSIDSFLLNHSVEYGVAAVMSWIEFLIEQWLFPGMKELTYISIAGLVLCIGGEILRKLAMCTAKTNFNHVVQSVHEDGHQLVTHGVYKYSRHPSYVGWFYWSIGTQIVLVNPICTLAYALASWRFFHDRILIEEVALLNFFGDEYNYYQKNVPTGLPFIHGYKHDL